MSEGKSTTISLPSVEDFCLNVPLYESYNKIDEFDEDQTYYAHIRSYYQNFSGKFDCFCIQYERESVFIHANNFPDEPQNKFGIIQNYGQGPDEFLVKRPLTMHYLFTLQFHCARNSSHVLRFVFRFYSGTLTKIGQYPSLADLAASEIKIGPHEIRTLMLPARVVPRRLCARPPL